MVPTIRYFWKNDQFLLIFWKKVYIYKFLRSKVVPTYRYFCKNDEFLVIFWKISDFLTKIPTPHTQHKLPKPANVRIIKSARRFDVSGLPGVWRKGKLPYICIYIYMAMYFFCCLDSFFKYTHAELFLRGSCYTYWKYEFLQNVYRNVETQMCQTSHLTTLYYFIRVGFRKYVFSREAKLFWSI